MNEPLNFKTTKQTKPMELEAKNQSDYKLKIGLMLKHSKPSFQPYLIGCILLKRNLFNKNNENFFQKRD